MRTACQIPFLEAKRLEHRFDNCDVFGLTAMRGAGEGKLLIAPTIPVEAAGLEQWHDLEGFRAGPPECDEARIPGNADRPFACIDDRRVDPVVRFDRIAPGDYDIELMADH